MSDTVKRYLERRAAGRRWPLRVASTDGIGQVVAIPVLAECPALFDTLADLAQNPARETRRTLVICVVNNRPPSHTAPGDAENNRAALARLSAMAAAGGLRLGYVDAASPGCELPEKEGVGLARKIGLDWGLQVLYANGAVDGPLISLDADTRVDEGYLGVLRSFFEDGGGWAGVVDYAHPLEGEEAAAILCYECFLRCHELGLVYTGSPYAFPSIGSTIVCTGHAYAAVSGMNRRQAGEDFYFLQQLAKTGPVDRITATTVRPSARASHRVPFGTGKRVTRFLGAEEEEYLVYDPASYGVVKAWLEAVTAHLDTSAARLLEVAHRIEPELGGFLENRGFAPAWTKLQSNCRNCGTGAVLLGQFHRWFDGFRTLKLLHHLRDNGYPRQEMFGAADALLERLGTLGHVDAGLRHDLDGQRRLLFRLRAACRQAKPRVGLG